MQRRRATERDQAVLRGHFTAFDRMHTGSVGHGFIDHLADAVSGQLNPKSQRLADRLRDRLRRPRRLKRHLAAGKLRRIDPPEHDVRVGHRRPLPATPIGGGPRIGAGALRPDTDLVHGIEARDRAATGTDFEHFNDRQPQGQAAALGKACRAVDLEFPGGLRGLILDQANLSCRAPHIEGNHLVER